MWVWNFLHFSRKIPFQTFIALTRSYLWVSLFMMRTLTGTEEDFSLLCICILCPALVATVKGTEVHIADIYRYYSPSCSSVICLCFRASWHLFLPAPVFFSPRQKRLLVLDDCGFFLSCGLFYFSAPLLQFHRKTLLIKCGKFKKH